VARAGPASWPATAFSLHHLSAKRSSSSSSSSGERSETGGRSGAGADLFRHDVGSGGVRDSVLLSQAAASPGLRREGAACRRMTREEQLASARYQSAFARITWRAMCG
jgi:hypothetical protein